MNLHPIWRISDRDVKISLSCFVDYVLDLHCEIDDLNTASWLPRAVGFQCLEGIWRIADDHLPAAVSDRRSLTEWFAWLRAAALGDYAEVPPVILQMWKGEVLESMVIDYSKVESVLASCLAYAYDTALTVHKCTAPGFELPLRILEWKPSSTGTMRQRMSRPTLAGYDRFQQLQIPLDTIVDGEELSVPQPANTTTLS